MDQNSFRTNGYLIDLNLCILMKHNFESARSL